MSAGVSDFLRGAEEKNATGAEGEMEQGKNLVLYLRAQIDQQIAA